jgi:peptidoglycan/LPS O-acetylase OafA/YrhL
MDQQGPKPSANPVPEEWDLRCKRCGYLLTGLTSNRCPECGESFDARAMLRERREARERLEQGERARPLVVLGWVILLVPIAALPSSEAPGRTPLLFVVALAIFVVALGRYRPLRVAKAMAFAGAALSLYCIGSYLLGG